MAARRSSTEADEWDPAFCRGCGWLDCECVKVGSLWKRNPPGREVVRVERVWTMGGEDLLRAHPVRGGRPLVTDADTLREGYTECVNPPGLTEDGQP